MSEIFNYWTNVSHDFKLILLIGAVFTFLILVWKDRIQ